MVDALTWWRRAARNRRSVAGGGWGVRVLGAGSRDVEMGAGRLKLKAGGRTIRGENWRIWGRGVDVSFAQHHSPPPSPSKTSPMRAPSWLEEDSNRPREVPKLAFVGGLLGLSPASIRRINIHIRFSQQLAWESSLGGLVGIREATRIRNGITPCDARNSYTGNLCNDPLR